MKVALGVVLCGIASGCWGAEPASDESMGQLSERSASEPAELDAIPPTVLDKRQERTSTACRALMSRQRECSTRFIPALVDARVERDEPPGIAARSREIGREALVAEGLEEWASDSRDAAIEAVCAEIARTVAPDRVAELETSVNACLERAGCDAFVACAVPVNLGRWKG
jgi:hypothetical protein